MPDQVRHHDPQLPVEERHLGLYGPHSPANSDSPLSLVVRKEDRRKLQAFPVQSPGRSSGFSDGSSSYESSPNRSPTHGQDCTAQSQSYDAQDPDKPLSLVVCKNLVSHFESAAEYSVPSPRYTVHAHTGQVPPKKKWRVEEECRRFQDSGNEEEEDEPALVISEQTVEEEEEEEEDRVIDEDKVYDFSTDKKGENEHFGERKEKTPGIKIKDFARLEVPAVSTETKEPPGAGDDAEDVSEAESDCGSVSSVDTWSSSLAEGKPFSGTDEVIRRVRRNSSGDPVYQCDFCDKLFANKYHLQSHLVTHTGERAFTCRTCKKTFGRKSTLRAHMTTHTKVSNFMCTVCEKACNDNNSLEEHMRMHTGEKPFVCTICQKAYARKSHLNVHYRVHTGERPFVCDYCNKDFTEKRFLNDHMQTAHNGVDGPLKCPNCAREFAYKTSLKQHLKKQMCERNMKRTHGNLGAGAVTKQFRCPFCEKSYSWKQTLKQHVSMYHKNKVHTDEFWRYELTKNRRNVMDDLANEDLWKQQLGKHAEEAAKLKKEAAEMTPAPVEDAEPVSVAIAPSPETGADQATAGWLAQVQTVAQAPKQLAVEPVTTEMKLLALQSLQSSLHFISLAGMSGTQLAAISSLQRLADMQCNLQTEVKVEPAGQDSYLALLAQLAQKESEERDSETARECSLSAVPAIVLPAKEESSVKRTQLWLQQVNKYRHKPPKEELDANHEQLWEQQISRVKRNPVRSPLEPVEIVIEDDGDKPASSASSPRVTLRSVHSRRSTVTNNNGEGGAVFPARLGHTPGPALVFPRLGHTPPARPATPHTPAPVSRPSPHPTPAPHPEEGCLLKSLLLDRTKRKRSSSKDTDPNSKKPLSPHSLTKPITIPEAPSDILRKRLLGLVDPPPAPKEPMRNPQEVPIRSQNTPPRTSEDTKPSLSIAPPAAIAPEAVSQVFKLELEDEEKKSRAQVKKENFAKSGVLKQLLHRYTGATQ